MPKWIHDRAEHLLAKNPSMPKSQAFAIATQQAHAVGKSPKGYGTNEGRRTAKAKYDTPKDDKKTANPGQLESAKMDKKAQVAMFAAFRDELTKIAANDNFLQALLKIANILPPGATAGGMMHAEGLLAGLAKKTPRLGRIAGEHNAIVNMARSAGHAGEGGSAIKSLIPGSGKPSLPPAATKGFSFPPLSSTPAATMPPSATIPAPRAA